jgi:cell volume regulation protein A
MDSGTITAFLAIGAAIFIGFFGNMVFQKFRIPDVLITILLGILIGPDLLGLVSLDTLDGIGQYRDFLLSAALVLILFEGGLYLDIRALAESMKLGTLIMLLTLFVEILACTLIMVLVLDIDIVLAVVFATIIGGTSEAVVIPVANRMRINSKTKSMLVMESMVTDVLTITIAITLMSLIATGSLSLMSLGREIAVNFLVGAGIGFVSGITWLFVLQRLQQQPLSYMLTVGALFLVAGFVEMAPIGSSGAVAALAFGLAIGNRRVVKRWLTSLTLRLSTDNHIQDFHSEIAFFVRTFFFVYLGVLIRFDSFTPLQLAVGVGIIVVILVVRRLTSRLAMSLGDLDKEDADAIWSMMPRGLATAVLATAPAAILAGTVMWDQDPGFESFILNISLIVIIGTTILATIISFAVERNVDSKNRKQLRKRLAADEY